MLELIQRAYHHTDRRAIVSNGQQHSYAELLVASEMVALDLLGHQSDLKEARVAFMIRPGFDYVKVQWAIWRAGGIAVPLSLHSPLPALQYVLEDANCDTLIADQEFTSLLTPLINGDQYRFFESQSFQEKSGTLPAVSNGRRAMIIYTSGTTGKPKGVVTTHANIESQISTLIEAWAWQEDDHILNMLPLHHVHGVINVVACALWAGACCEFVAQFDSEAVIRSLTAGEINVFMAVPTVYYKLIDHWKSLPDKAQKHVFTTLSKFRLMVSGSAALPVSVMETWQEISGQRLLERYGMTEIGMAISNAYAGERRAGHIGKPLPGVQIRLVDDHGNPAQPDVSGEIQVKGASVFKEYWNKPEATEASFTPDGWFKTGDVAILNRGSYRIMGRQSVDIIKSGGYKISALEIEEVLRTHPAIADCAVVGISDTEWSEVVAAAIVLENATSLEIISLKAWLKERIPSYQLPRKVLFIETLPRNAMGKVTKSAVKEMFDRQA